MITKISFESMPNYVDMNNNGDFAQPGAFGRNTAIRFNINGSYCTHLEFMSNNDWVLDTFTISVWIKNNRADYSPLICESNASTIYGGIDLSYYGPKDTSTTRYPLLFANANKLVSDRTYNLNQWAHIAFVRDASKNHYIFINGRLSNTPSNFTNSDLYEAWNNKTLMIGSESTNFFYGLMDDLVVTKDVLWTSNFTVPNNPMGKLYPNTNFLLNLGEIQSTVLKVY